MINSRRTARTSPQRHRGLAKASQNQIQVIYGRHEQCRWRGSWANLLYFTPNLKMYRHISLKMQQMAQLRCHRHSPWGSYIIRFAF